MNTKSFNVALKLAAREVVADDALMLDSLETTNVTVGSGTKRRIKRALRYAENDSHKIPIWKQIVAACIIVFVVSVGVAMSMPDVRAALWDAIVAWFDDYMSIVFESNNSENVPEKIEKIVLPSYIPDGYEIDNIFESTNIGYYQIKSSSGERAYYYQMSMGSEMLVDNTDVKISSITLNGDISATLFVYKNGERSITWTDDYAYALESTDLSLKELIKIAESVNKRK